MGQRFRRFRQASGLYVGVPLLTTALIALLVTRPSIRAKDASDWLDLLVVPIALAIGGLAANQYFSARDQQQLQQKRDIAFDRERQDALIDYFDQMTLLLLDDDWPGSHLRHKSNRQHLNQDQREAAQRIVAVARARSLAALRDLDGERKGSVVRFLVESGALQFIPLTLANLEGAHLMAANLREANLRGASLVGADLRRADLRGANLRGANLKRASLVGADLRRADLREANLKDADLRRADLQGSFLNKAYVKGAKLKGAITEGAVLKEIP